MKTYDWIVIGAGLVGSAMGYELAKAGFSVLLLEQWAQPPNATRYSYGGVAYWSGDTALTQTLCQESEAIYLTLSEELGYPTGFRELDLVLTIGGDRDPKAIAALYKHCRTPPTLIDPSAATQIEPLLNPEAIAAALWVRHGNVDPESLTYAYQQGLICLGGIRHTAEAQGFEYQGDRLQGVVTAQQTYSSGNILVCAGGLSRALLRRAGIATPLYFTRAELLETSCLDLHLSATVMPAELSRIGLEAIASRPEYQACWDQPGHEPAAPILDAGAIQLADGRVRMGQISRVLTDPGAPLDAVASEAQLRDRLGHLIPALQSVPATWASCLVAFSGDRLPLVGAIPGVEGLYLASGFNGPFLWAPPLARRFAQSQSGKPDDILPHFSPSRFKEQSPQYS